MNVQHKTMPGAAHGNLSSRERGAPSYRPDIDGLRAIAVLSVVLFHVSAKLLPGGFAGVDVFFVISGYLITTIVHREIDAGEFSILRFYERRIRRIYPALLATLSAVVVASFLIFMPDELRDLGTSVVSTVTFCSNLLFWTQTDYFAGPAEFKPLLHTWSLAVEEQFYIVLPPLLMLLARLKPFLLKPTIIALLLVSFAASCAWTWIDPSGNYFLPHTRAWELLVGSALAIGLVPVVQSVVLNELIAAAGFASLILPFFLLNEGAAFPAWNALATCLGTAVLIHTGRHQATLVGRGLSIKPLVGLGLISYSVYLVHWPLIVFTRYQLLREPNAVEAAALVSASLVLGWTSWRFVEQPFRSRSRFSRPFLFRAAAAASVLFAAVGAASFASGGFPQRLGKLARQAARDDTQTVNTAGCFLKRSWTEWRGRECFLTQGSGPVTLLWGDSHANHYASAVRQRAAAINAPVLLYASAGCAPVLNVNFGHRKDCRANNSRIFDIIKQYHVRRVLLSAYWERVFEENGIHLSQLSATVRRLQSEGVTVTVIGDNPDFPFSNPHYLAIRLARRDHPDASFHTEVRNDFGFNRRLEAAVRPAGFVDPMQYLCRRNECLAYNRGKLIMRDNSHFSSFGAATAWDAMRPLQW